ncbi:MAG: rRNA maturation RNase YbeY [Solirubrobacteraceae bacterium]|jgi:probable rRNA maturation factor
MIDVELFGAGLASQAPRPEELRRLCALVAARVGIEQGHVAIEFVDAARIAALNGEHRGKATPTDVLSFPIDGVEPFAGAAEDARSPAGGTSTHFVPRELGDIVICPEHTTDVREAIVHGMLHLLGMDHETDDGEMLALQRELLAGAGG